MRIAGVIHQFPPAFETGTEILCLRSMQALAARGYEIGVFAADPLSFAGRPPSEEIVEGIAVVRIPTARPSRISLTQRMRDEFENPAAAKPLLAAIRAFRPDVVHLYQALQFGLGVVPSLAEIAPVVETSTDFYLACPLVTAMLEDGRPCPGPSSSACAEHYLERQTNQIAAASGLRRQALAWRRRLARWTMHDTPARFAAVMKQRQDVSKAALDALAVAMIGPPRLYDMIDGARRPNVERFGHAAPPLAVPERSVGDPLTVGFYSSLAHHKGLHVLLDAIEAIPAGTPMRFVICGPPGPDPRYVQDQQARAARDPRIVFKLGVPHAKMAEELGQADIVVVPSLWDENEPLVLLDALEAGRYALVSDRPGLTGPLNSPRGGLAFPPGDGAALARCLEGLARDTSPVRQARWAPARGSSFPAYIEQVEARYRQAVKTANPVTQADPRRHARS